MKHDEKKNENWWKREKQQWKMMKQRAKNNQNWWKREEQNNEKWWKRDGKTMKHDEIEKPTMKNDEK